MLLCNTWPRCTLSLFWSKCDKHASQSLTEAGHSTLNDTSPSPAAALQEHRTALAACLWLAGLQHSDEEYGEHVNEQGQHYGGPFTIQVSAKMRIEELRKVIRVSRPAGCQAGRGRLSG